MTRPGYVFVDFLEKRHVGHEVRECFNDSLRTVAAIPSADTFVDVIRHESQMHVKIISATHAP
jgi:hypothetical protein